MRMKDFPGYAKFALLTISIAMVIAAMRYADLLLVPMVWALLLTLMVLPIAKWLERRIKYRALTAILTISIFVIIVGGVFFLFSTQALRLRGDGPLIEKKLSESMNDLREFVDSNLGVPFEQQPEVLKDRLSSASESVFQKVGNTVQSTLTGLGLMVIVPIYMFFFITYRDRFSRFVVMLVERRKQIQALDILSKASTVVQKYLVGVGIEVLIVFVLAATLFFSLGIRHALFFAVMVAVLNIIPYLGVLIGSSISVVYAFLTTDSLLYPILVFVLLWVIQIIDNNFIAPYVIGQQIRLNPLAVIVAVFVGGLIWGVSGMIVFIPLLGILKVVLDESESLKPWGFLLGDRSSK